MSFDREAWRNLATQVCRDLFPNASEEKLAKETEGLLNRLEVESGNPLYEIKD